MTTFISPHRQRSSTIRAEEYNKLHLKAILPKSPTTFLPPLKQLASASPEHLQHALLNLRKLYFSEWGQSEQVGCNATASDKQAPVIGAGSITLPPRPFAQHIIHDASVPDSGYASAEEDEDEYEDANCQGELEVLRADPLERAFSIKWLTGFVARSDLWISFASSGATSADDEDTRAEILDDAVALLSLFNGHEEDEDIALTRTFRFCLGPHTEVEKAEDSANEILIELNDAPLSKDDHTSVGLQSWGSCILFAERMCASPSTFGLYSSGASLFSATSSAHTQGPQNALRILELGAGTGMLSIAALKILQTYNAAAEIVATDYHPDVLDNLEGNVKTNFSSSSDSHSLKVAHLDWEHPPYNNPECGEDSLFSEPFDIILAADIVYHPSHALWIKKVVERLLRRDGGAFWLFIPIRTSGRHEGVYQTVEALFPSLLMNSVQRSEGGGMLSIVDQEVIERRDGIGRADESGYRLFRIGWVQCL